MKIKWTYHFLYHDKRRSQFSVNQKRFQEPQIHDQQRQGKHASCNGKRFINVKMTHKQSSNKQNVWQQIHRVPEVVQISFHSGIVASVRATLGLQTSLVRKLVRCLWFFRKVMETHDRVYSKKKNMYKKITIDLTVHLFAKIVKNKQTFDVIIIRLPRY